MSHNLGGGMTTDDEDLIDFRKNEEIYKAFYEGIIDEPFEGSSDGLSRVTKNTFGQPFPENFEKFSKFHRIFLKFFFEFFIEYPFFSIFQYFQKNKYEKYGIKFCIIYCFVVALSKNSKNFLNFIELSSKFFPVFLKSSYIFYWVFCGILEKSRKTWKIPWKILQNLR